MRRRIHQRDHDPMPSAVQRLLDERRVVRGDTHDRRHLRPLHRPHNLFHGLPSCRAVLGVDHQPIHAKTGHQLGDRGRGEADPLADGQVAFAQALLGLVG